MMNFTGDWRERRNLLNQGISFGPMHYTISNYSTDSQIDKKSDMKTTFGSDDLLNRLHAIRDPLKKNLADTVITGEDKNKKNKEMASDIDEFYYEDDMEPDKVHSKQNSSRNDFYQSLTGITGFFTSVFGAISGAMFQRRAKSPVSQYYDCFDHNAEARRERSPSLAWQASKLDDQNKNERAREQFGSIPPNDNMNNCRAPVARCEEKLNVVRSLLTSKPSSNPSRIRSRRPRRVFVEPGSVEDSFEDAFTPEDFVSLANEEYIEYFSVRSNQGHELCEVDAPKMKLNVGPVQESAEIMKQLPVSEKVTESSVTKSVIIDTKPDVNRPECTEIVKNITNTSDTVKIPDLITKTNQSTKLDAVEVKPIETTEIVKILPEIEVSKPQLGDLDIEKKEVITSCEDKMARLKSLLQEKRKKNTNNKQTLPDSVREPVKETEQPKKTKIIPIEKSHDKKYKNPKRLSTDKRKKCKLRKNIQEDALFANEIESEDVSSVENSPKCISSNERLSKHPSVESIEDKEYFDEVKGRFRSASTTESEDSFQIVFSDSPKLSRARRPSDCDSEDSFIVFEESPDSCYTSNDVFGEESSGESDDECSDDESEVSDSGCVSEVCKLSHSLSRTISDLTDDSLYEEKKVDSDEVDCAFRTACDVIPTEGEQDLSDVEVKGKPGLLVDEARKRQKKDLPAKKVTFSAQPPKVHVMRVWAFAARQARAGHWERHALDRERFKRRIADVDMAVSWVLKPQHRSRVMFQRFMPWWNAQRRKELAEKKKREEEEKLRREEEERLRKEAEEQAKIDGVVEDVEGTNEESNIDITVDNKESIINNVDGSKISESIDVKTDIKVETIEMKNEVNTNIEKTQNQVTNKKDTSKMKGNHKKNVVKDEKLEAKVLNIINKRKVST